ncbi:hypothetical protein BLNAU_15083 [Blattamonas nauphoetae]|uniref:Uncharacterized protein n=1 Tax=Blattamonas nauphoetae TaxID=2049346 RepID=A0ABQ9XBP8_9EUKA|nr:hypothetical protein BLNAU_15083 [Blattamonas nauphoetae]
MDHLNELLVFNPDHRRCESISQLTLSVLRVKLAKRNCSSLNLLQDQAKTKNCCLRGSGLSESCCIWIQLLCSRFWCLPSGDFISSLPSGTSIVHSEHNLVVLDQLNAVRGQLPHQNIECPFRRKCRNTFHHSRLHSLHIKREWVGGLVESVEECVLPSDKHWDFHPVRSNHTHQFTLFIRNRAMFLPVDVCAWRQFALDGCILFEHECGRAECLGVGRVNFSHLDFHFEFLVVDFFVDDRLVFLLSVFANAAHDDDKDDDDEKGDQRNDQWKKPFHGFSCFGLSLLSACQFQLDGVCAPAFPKHNSSMPSCFGIEALVQFSLVQSDVDLGFVPDGRGE